MSLVFALSTCGAISHFEPRTCQSPDVKPEPDFGADFAKALKDGERGRPYAVCAVLVGGEGGKKVVLGGDCCLALFT